MPNDQRPPEHIWLNNEELTEHFKRIRERSSKDDKGQNWEEVPDLDQNELTRNLR